ncbi:synaptonemal complex protein 2-like [Oryzias latipes]|uniref:synaptonemal complex protein 2-like n=1 Tax=Oryzias latipes TaxID=8090 RepID=UPI000CE233DD|nr:synaptonemal complex protein 2-like [Oryzias latipes]
MRRLEAGVCALPRIWQKAEERRAMLEVQVENCLAHADLARLVLILRSEGLSRTTLVRMDQLVAEDLGQCHFGRVLLVLKSFDILSGNTDELLELLDSGLTGKVVQWFQTVQELLTSDLHRGSASLMNLVEEFFDFFLLLGQASLPVSQLSVILLQLAHLALEPEVHFPLRLEAIRTFNNILESMSREQRRLIQHEQNQIQLLFQLAAAVLTAGDYELQVSLSEALCRLTPRRDREQRSIQWFSSCEVSRAFCDIRDADFEVDCRRFLNFVNGCHGDQSRIYTFACQQAFLGSTQLFCPKDEKLDSFWIDFNMGSGCLSFFIDDPQGFLWGTVHLPREEVNHYSIKVQQEETVLTVELNSPIILHNCRSHTVELSFSYKHHRDLEEAVGKVFQKVPSLPRTVEWEAAEAFPSTDKPRARSYNRKRPPRKSQLKILPMSSPCSSEGSPSSKIMGKSRAEILFDQIRSSTPTFHDSAGFQLSSDVADDSQSEHHLSDGLQPASQDCEMADLHVSQDFQRSISPSKNEGLRKREAPDSGYLSDQTEGKPAHKKQMESPQDGDKSQHTDGEGTDCSFTKGVWSVENHMQSVNKEGAELESHVSSGIKAAFKDFRDQLEHSFTSCWQKVEAEVLLSLEECQHHVSSLLTSVHQHRMLFLQQFESTISDELKHLEENTTTLNSINSQILSFFQTEKQRFGGFCENLQKRLKSLDGGQKNGLQSS